MARKKQQGSKEEPVIKAAQITSSSTISVAKIALIGTITTAIVTILVAILANLPTIEQTFHPAISSTTPTIIAQTGSSYNEGKIHEIYEQLTKTSPFLSDPLSGSLDSTLQWQTSSTASQSCTFKNGTYHITTIPTSKEPSPIALCFSRSLTARLSNFALRVVMKVDYGSGGGIIFHSDSTDPQSVMYRVRIANDQSFDFFVEKDDPSQNGRLSACPVNTSNLLSTILPSNQADPVNPAILVNQENIITLIVQDKIATLFVNDQEIRTVCDTTYATGAIGLFAAAYQEKTEVEFHDLKLWKL